MDWRRDLPGWPRAETSRKVACRPHRWHVQEAGTGPDLLFLHGAGGSTHSWRDVIPQMAGAFRTLAIDLPGQGFSERGTGLRLSLETICGDIAALCAQEGWRPVAIVGHSAGGAIALRLSERLEAPHGGPPRVVTFNAALTPFDGVAGWLFPILAKLLVLNPLVPSLFSLGSGDPRRVRQLIAGTGSELSDEGIALYAKLLGDRGHVDGTLRMMAQWKLDTLLDHLAGLDTPTTLIAGARDAAVAPDVSRRAAEAMPDARFVMLDGLGHLAHEEDPARAAAEIRAALALTPSG
mgnify:CR=1 FL=1